MKSLSVAVLSMALAVGVPAVAMPPVAQAQVVDGRSPAGSAAEPHTSAEASAREHFQRGQRLSAAGDHAAAYREFAAGYALTERPLFLFHMAESARASGQLDKARASYDAFLRADPNAALAATARERLAALDAPAAPAPSASAPAPSLAAPHAAPGDVAPTPAPGEAPPSSVEPGVPPPWAISGPPPGHRRHDEDLAIAPVADASDRGPMWRRWPFWVAMTGIVVGSIAVYAIVHDGGPCGGCSELDFR